MKIGRIEDDFIIAKRGVRELVETITPENGEKLDLLLKEVDNLVMIAVNKKVKQVKLHCLIINRS